jgi:hypothetical protein
MAANDPNQPLSHPAKPILKSTPKPPKHGPAPWVWFSSRHQALAFSTQEDTCTRSCLHSEVERFCQLSFRQGIGAVMSTTAKGQRTLLQ